MMTATQIVALSNQVARRAAKLKRQPYVFFNAEEITQDPPNFRTIPNIGSYRPRGWKLVNHWLVDKEGCSDTGGPAWGIRELRRQMLLDFADPHTYGYAIIEEGVFQVVVGKFKQNGKRVNGN